VTYFKVPGFFVDENMKAIKEAQGGNRFHNRNYRSGLPKQEAAMLTAQPFHCVRRMGDGELINN
jgi:hypothetical protein